MTPEATVVDGVLRVAVPVDGDGDRDGEVDVGTAPAARWLSTGWRGGYADAPAAYNLSVPEGWERRDLDAYLRERFAAAGLDGDGPALLTGVAMRHARGARAGATLAVATVGVSNPAALPMAPGERDAAADDRTSDGGSVDHASDGCGDGPSGAGTVNLVVLTERALDDAALATLLGVVVEAKAATLLDLTGFPGTTTDAAVVGTAGSDDPTPFAGAATAVGAEARACVRDAIRASFESRYADRDPPASVAAAEHGVITDRRAETFSPEHLTEPDRSRRDETESDRSRRTDTEPDRP